MTPRLFEPLATARLDLCEPGAEHASLMFEAFSSDADVTRYLRWSPHQSLTEAEMAMVRRLERLHDRSELSWVVFLRAAGTVAGIVSLWPAARAAELGFAFSRSVWGQGLSSEAAGAVLGWAFDRLGVERVWASCDIENRASMRVLEKLGMRRERLATLRDPSQPWL